MDRRLWAAVLLIVVGLAAALPVLAARSQREQANTLVDLVVDLGELRDLALNDGVDLGELLADLQQAGITAVAVPEISFEDLARHRPVVSRQGSDLRQLVTGSPAVHPHLRRLVDAGRIDANFHYIVSDRPEVAADLWERLGLRLPPAQVNLYEHRAEAYLAVIEVAYSPQRLNQLRVGLGFSERDIELVRAAGLRPVPRPTNPPVIDADGVRRTVAEIAALMPETHTVIFGGGQILGYPQHVALTAELLRQNGWQPGLIEHPTQLHYLRQEGLTELAERMDYAIVRVHSFDRKELDLYSPADTVDRWVRSVRERNIRAVYLRPFLTADPGLSLTESNVKYLGLLSERLRAVGLAPGAPLPMAFLAVPPLQTGLVGLGAAGGALLWLALAWPVRAGYLAALAAVAAAGSLGAVWLAPNTGPLLLALAAAVFYPALGITWCLRRWLTRAPAPPGAVLREGGWAVGAMVAACLVGGLLIGALLGDSRYLLEFRFFRGVKLALVLPLLLAVLTYFSIERGAAGRLSRQAILADLAVLWRRPLQWGHVALGGIFLVALYVFLVRSGNVHNFPLLGLELKFRAALDQILFARPRTKEFLIGYPALVLAVLAWSRRLPALLLPLALAGVIAGASVVNTFAHLRAPLALSLVRSLHGAWLGLALGLAAAAVAVALLRAAPGWGRDHG